MRQLTARAHLVQAAVAGENLLGQLPEAAKMTIRSTPSRITSKPHIHG
jgi:hypothetical protein